MFEKIKTFVVVAAVLIFLIGLTGYQLVQYNKCGEMGKTAVRGAFTFVCVDAK